MAHRHFDEADPRYQRVGPCRFRTRKECDENYADWQAMKQVKLAQQIVDRDGGKLFRKDKTVFGQLVKVLAGQQATILNDDGLPSQQPFTRRLMKAVDALAYKGHSAKEALENE